MDSHKVKSLVPGSGYGLLRTVNTNLLFNSSTYSSRPIVIINYFSSEVFYKINDTKYEIHDSICSFRYDERIGISVAYRI